MFIADALPGDACAPTVQRRKNNWEQATIAGLAARELAARAAGARISATAAAARCSTARGGAGRHQAARGWKTRSASGKVKAERCCARSGPPGATAGARLSVRFVAKKGKVLVGFHERKSQLRGRHARCEVLPPHLSAMLLPLRAADRRHGTRDRLPQIEVAVGDTVTALVLRHLEPGRPSDLARLRASRPNTACNGGCSPRAGHRALLDEGGPELAYTPPSSAS